MPSGPSSADSSTHCESEPGQRGLVAHHRGRALERHQVRRGEPCAQVRRNPPSQGSTTPLM